LPRFGREERVDALDPLYLRPDAYPSATSFRATEFSVDGNDVLLPDRVRMNG
jgi:hypothetical protein